MQISEFKMHNNKKMITWRPNETTGFGPPPLSACEPREGRAGRPGFGPPRSPPQHVAEWGWGLGRSHSPIQRHMRVAG